MSRAPCGPEGKKTLHPFLIEHPPFRGWQSDIPSGYVPSTVFLWPLVPAVDDFRGFHTHRWEPIENTYVSRNIHLLVENGDFLEIDFKNSPKQCITSTRIVSIGNRMDIQVK